MQYGRALDRLICEIVYADTALGYFYLLKADVSDRFYRIGLRPTDAPKLGLIFPSGKEEEQMVATPLTLPMGWKNSPPLFCTAMETVADLANEALRTHQLSKQHLLDIRVKAVEPPPAPLLTQDHANLTRDPYHKDVHVS